MNKEELIKSITEKLSEKFVGKEVSADTQKLIEETLYEELTKAVGTTEDDLEKAVTSEAAAAENKLESEDVLNGENAPTIQDAKSPSEEPTAGEVELKDQKTPEGIDENQAKGGATQELSFGDMFSDKPFTLGSTLVQAPNGNVMANVKPSKIDYVEEAKNKKNQVITAEELKDQK